MREKRLDKNYEGNEMGVLKSAHQESGFVELVGGSASMSKEEKTNKTIADGVETEELPFMFSSNIRDCHSNVFVARYRGHNKTSLFLSNCQKIASVPLLGCDKCLTLSFIWSVKPCLPPKGFLS